MRNQALLIIFAFVSLSLSAQDQGMKNLFVGTFTSEGAEGIYLCQFDENEGKLTMKNVFKGISDPSFMSISPNREHLYVVTRVPAEIEKTGGYIQAYQIGPEGNLVYINKQISNGAGPCHVDVSPNGRFAAIATYGGGNVSLYELNSNGSIEKASITIQNKGQSVHPSRQKAPHAHSVLFSPDGKQLFSADLGTDRLNIFDVKGNKIISAANQSFVKMPPGAGPRHFALHPAAKTIYVINELNSTITVLKNSGRKWKEQQIITTLPDNFSGENYCADIHVSADGRYLYGSNRGHNSIAVYTIHPKTKKLEWVTAVSTHGDWPRNFTLSEDGKFLLAANQRSGNITVFRINQQTGIPEFTGHELHIPAPVCLVFQ